MDVAAAQAFLWNLASEEDDVEDVPESKEEEDVTCSDDTARLPSSKRQKLRKCLGIKRTRLVAPRVEQVLDTAGSDPDEEPLPDCREPLSSPEATFRSGQSARAAQPRVPCPDPDLEAEQRMNALLKERYRRLTEAAAIDLVSDEEEEAEADEDPAPAPPAAEQAACDTDAQQAAGAKLKLKVTPQAGVPKVLRIGASEPLRKLFTAFQQHAVSAGSMPADAQPSFWFDGDKLHDDATAEDLELEDGFVIDCKW